MAAKLKLLESKKISPNFSEPNETTLVIKIISSSGESQDSILEERSSYKTRSISD